MIFWITISQTIAVQNRTWANKVIVKTLFLKPERVHFIKMTNFESKNVYEIHLDCMFSFGSTSLSVLFLLFTEFAASENFG